MMTSQQTRELLKDPKVKGPGKLLIDKQREVWDKFGVDRDVGCRALDSIEPNKPEHAKLFELKEKFIHTAMRTFLQVLEDRRPETLEAEGPMSRETIIEFFDACNTKMDLPETEQRLSEHFQAKKEVPNQLIIDIQREMLEILGFKADHGCQLLSQIPETFQGDKELLSRFSMWQRKAHMTCMQVVHKAAGTQLKESLVSNPDMAVAKQQIDEMTPEQRGDHLQRMQQRIQVFMNLPHERRKQYLQDLPAGDRLDLLKAQLLMVAAMQQQAVMKQQEQGTSSAGPQRPPMQQEMM